MQCRHEPWQEPKKSHQADYIHVVVLSFSSLIKPLLLVEMVAFTPLLAALATASFVAAQEISILFPGGSDKWWSKSKTSRPSSCRLIV